MDRDRPVNPIMEPNATNRYIYVDGNPVNRVDSTGRDSCVGAVARAAIDSAGFGIALGGLAITTGGAGSALTIGTLFVSGFDLPFSIDACGD
ncbi:hypothetical protein [Amycolatopsis sp. cmx-8-4]|uniref:hypothetical protein n=1 Tax=Amycolatopsis sp. cmx-8-4 TaxID=2790947 RepID=UPI0039796E94